MEKIKDEFLAQFTPEISEKVALPKRIEDQYLVEECCKYTADVQIYLILSKADYTLKILKCTGDYSAQSAREEYIVLTMVQHPGLPRAVDFIREGSMNFLIREYIPGLSLADTIASSGPFHEKKAIEVLLSICGIVGYLHGLNPPIIHRDIKPQNIVCTPKGEYRLIDLGTARQYKPSESKDTVFMGTEATAAPEQYGYRQTDRRSDIYGLGMLLIFLLTGEYRFEEDKLAALSKPVRRIIKKCIAFDPANRYRNVEELAAKLTAALHRQKLIKACVAWAAAAAVIAGTAGIAGWYFTRPDPAALARFSSPLIERAVRLELGKTSSDPLYIGELDQVKQLIVCGDEPITDSNRHRSYGAHHYVDGEEVSERGDISSLEDLKALKNLKIVVLDRQNISDLSPLKGLALEKLSMCANAISDLSPLKEMDSLSELKIEENPFTDLSVVRSMKQLTVLDAGYSQVEDIRAIEDLPLKELYLVNVLLSDYSAVATLEDLEILALTGMSPKYLEDLGRLPALRNLTLYDSGLESLELFSGFSGLTGLDVFNNRLESLNGIEDLTGLTHLGVGNNPLTTLDAVLGNQSLNSLDITSAKVTDYSVLAKLPNLKTLFCNKEQSVKIRETLTEIAFEIVVQNW